MNSNTQITDLNRELKQVLIEIQETDTPEKKTNLENYAQELRDNIQNLSLSAELDYELIAKTMLLRATANALLFKICKKKELQSIIQELYECGVPREVLTADKEVLTKYLTDIEHEQPTKYERYHEFIRIVQSKSYKSSPEKKQEFLKDFNWLLDDNSLAAQVMEMFDLDSNDFQKMIGNKSDENFEKLVDRYHLLQAV